MLKLPQPDMPLVIPEAIEKQVCRICGEQAGPRGPHDPFVLNFGTEYAHRRCLDNRYEHPTNIMKKIQITMPDGSLWQVPAEIVAQNRSDYYRDGEGEESGKREYANTLEDNSELMDWAENNMNWNDVEHTAICVRPGRVDFQEGWVNGLKTVVGTLDKTPTICAIPN